MKGPLALPEGLSSKGYVKAWNVLNFRVLLLNSLLYAFAGTALAVIIASMPAYALGRFRIPGGTFIFVVLLTGMMLPQQTVVIPLYDVLRRINLLDSRLGLIIVHGVYGFPFVLLILRGFVVGIPEELESAARVDGCSDIGVFRHVIIPLIMPAVAVAFALNFINIWKEFFFALIFLSEDTNFPITVGILKVTHDQYFSSWNMPAAALIMAQLPAVILYVLAYRWITQGIYAGAVKG
jgi:raffinose/stachyose/melibiose transport system permease protein